MTTATSQTAAPAAATYTVEQLGAMGVTICVSTDGQDRRSTVSWSDLQAACQHPVATVAAVYCDIRAQAQRLVTPKPGRVRLLITSTGSAPASWSAQVAPEPRGAFVAHEIVDEDPLAEGGREVTAQHVYRRVVEVDAACWAAVRDGRSYAGLDREALLPALFESRLVPGCRRMETCPAGFWDAGVVG